MSSSRVVRPIVRAFVGRFARDAAAHVRAGGHAVVWETPSRARLVFQVPKDEMSDFGYWSVLDLGGWRWSVARSGPFRGLATAPVPKDGHDVVKRRSERDSIHEGTRRVVLLDCLTCAACCTKNRVLLEKDDLARFARAGRMELARHPYARKDGTKIVLRLLKSGDCRHLGRDNRCGIYAIRPDSCSTFPMASESCLFAREEALGIADGVPTL